PLLIPHLTFFLFITPRPPTSTLFPYTTLFRSRDGALDESEDAVEVDGHGLPPLLGRHFINGRVVGRPDAVVGHENIKPAEAGDGDRKSTRLNSSHRTISYAVFCLKKKKKKTIR